jgi:hypothetical protein
MIMKNVVLKVIIAASMFLLVHSSQATGGDTSASASAAEPPRYLRRSSYYSIQNQNKEEPKRKRVEPDYVLDLTLEEDLVDAVSWCKDVDTYIDTIISMGIDRDRD